MHTQGKVKCLYLVKEIFIIIMEVFHLLNDEDEDIVEFIEEQRRPYIVHERYDAFNELDDVDFVRRFRLSKNTVLFILEQIEEAIETPTDR